MQNAVLAKHSQSFVELCCRFLDFFRPVDFTEFCFEVVCLHGCLGAHVNCPYIVGLLWSHRVAIY